MLALIAGRGKLPSVIVDALPELPYIASLDGYDPDILIPDRRFRIEHLGSLLADFRSLGITDVCFAGSIARPPLDPSRIDTLTMPLVPQMMAALKAGDDGALRTVLSIFENAGFKVRAPNELSSALLPVPATHTSRRTERHHEDDATRAAAVIAGLGSLDIGQSCAVKAGQVLAVEGVFGTDWMLESLARRPDGAGGIFFKAKKPTQDVRIDLPTIGVDTVARVAKAGLDGLVVEAGGVIVLDLAAVTRAADEAGVFLWVRDP